jgi:UDP:flavonoid glycosyltransferase YjiC (YdhE family)
MNRDSLLYRHSQLKRRLSATLLDSMVVLEASITALAELDMQVVLTTGHHALPKKLPPLAANVIHERYVPGLAMAARSDVLIHHGGYGSC